MIPAADGLPQLQVDSGGPRRPAQFSSSMATPGSPVQAQNTLFHFACLPLSQRHQLPCIYPLQFAGARLVTCTDRDVGCSHRSAFR